MEAATAAPPASSTSGEGRSPDEETLATQTKEADARAGGEPLPGEGADEQGVEEDPALPPLRMRGAGKQLTLQVGGEAPTKSEVKLRGGSIEISSGEFDKGEFVDIVARCRVREVTLADHYDRQTGEVTQTIRRHVLVIENIERAE